MTEMWLPVVGWEGLYEVSDCGLVRSLRRTFIRRDGTPMTVRGKVIRGRRTGRYMSVSLCGKGDPESCTIHRLVMEAFVGASSLDVCHNDGNSLNNALNNLRYDTESANTYDSITHGTHFNAGKTHCKQGHLFDETNTYRRPRGGRGCRECTRISGRRYDHKTRNLMRAS